MIPEYLLNRPLLYYGEVERVRERNEEVEQEIGVPETAFIQFLVLSQLPGAVVHELSHYLVAKVLLVDVKLVVFFQFSMAIPGITITEKVTKWKREVIKASPLLFSVPLIVFISERFLLTLGAGKPISVVYGLVLLYVAFHGKPDQV